MSAPDAADHASYQEAAPDAAQHASYQQAEYPQDDYYEAPRRPAMAGFSVVLTVLISFGLAAMLSLPRGWHASEGGPKQNYYLGLWRFEAHAFKLDENGDPLNQTVVDDRCNASATTVKCGVHSIFESFELGCENPTWSGPKRRLLEIEAFTPETWCALWTQLSLSSLVMLICGGTAVLFLWISAWFGQSRFALNHSKTKTFLFCIGPSISMGGLIYYAVTTFDFPAHCENGADFCGLFVVYGFGPAFWATSMMTLFGFVPAVIACATMPDKRANEDWEQYAFDSFQPHAQANHQTWHNQDPTYAGYQQDMGQGLVQRESANMGAEWTTEYQTYQEDYTVKRVKRGHCVSCTIVFVAIFILTGLCMPFGWHTTNGGDLQKYYIGLYRIEVEPQNKNFTSGHVMTFDEAKKHGCADPNATASTANPNLMRCGAWTIFEVKEEACEDPDSSKCALWSQVFLSSLVMFICGSVSVLLFVVGVVYGQCKFAHGARCLKLIFLGLAPAASIGGLVYYFISTKDFPAECIDGLYSCNLFGFGPVFWGCVLLTVYGLLPFVIVACTRPAPRHSELPANYEQRNRQEHGVEMSTQVADAPVEVPEQQPNYPMQAQPESYFAQFQQPVQENIPLQENHPYEDTQVSPVEEAVQEEAPSVEPEPVEPEPPKETWEAMLARLGAEKKKKQEEEQAAKLAEEARLQEEIAANPPVEEPPKKVSIVPEAKVSIVPEVKVEEPPQKHEPPPNLQEQQKSNSAGKVRIDLLSEQDEEEEVDNEPPKAAAKFCSQCGTAFLQPTSKFCNECGASRSAPGSKPLDAPPGSAGSPGSSSKRGLRGVQRKRDKNADSESRNPPLSPLPEVQPPRSPRAEPQAPLNPPSSSRTEEPSGHRSELSKLAANALPPKRDYALPVPQGNFGGFRQSEAPPKNFLDDDAPKPTGGNYFAPPPQSNPPPSNTQQGGYQFSAGLGGPVGVQVSVDTEYQQPAPSNMYQPPQQMGFGGQQPTDLRSAANQALGSQNPSTGYQQQGMYQQPPADLRSAASQALGSQNPSSGFQQQGRYQQQPQQDMYGQTRQQQQPQQDMYGQRQQPQQGQTGQQASPSGDFGLSAPAQQTPAPAPPRQPPSWGFVPPQFQRHGDQPFALTPSTQPAANNPYSLDQSQFPRTTPSPHDGYYQTSQQQQQPQQQPASWGFMPPGHATNFQQRR